MDKILPDLIVAWPQHMDYPLWRQQLRDHRHRFGKVIIVITNMNVTDNYRNFLTTSMWEDNVTILVNDKVTGRDDWRNIAVNKALANSTSEWVWFTEQDFFFKPGFWELVQEQMSKVEYIRTMAGDRVHPCCIFLKRSMLDQTKKDFSVIRDVSDHFRILQNDLSNTPSFDIPSDLWEHLGGLSQNMFLLMNGESNFYMKDSFDKYVKDCLQVSVPNHPDFIKLFEGYKP